ncbi:hypothetical protein B9Z55_022884 [Caenorhabditis nigoni]|uniref:Uncharacterized protein n=1 Tax=Caenorhabditis nigoni TaxID=1611254 RepID=A0A2G5SM61_9PELO|nr:hypothetical protein B9Z55_022884 [Caenorhabditis nigoni]
MTWFEEARIDKVEAAQAQYNVPNRKCEGEDKCQNESRIPPNAECMGLIKPIRHGRRRVSSSFNRSIAFTMSNPFTMCLGAFWRSKNQQKRQRNPKISSDVCDQPEIITSLLPTRKNLWDHPSKSEYHCVKKVEETDEKQFDEDMVHHFGEHQKDNFFIDLADGCEFQEDNTPTTSHAWILDSLTFLEQCRKHNWEFGSRERFSSVAIMGKMEAVL